MKKKTKKNKVKKSTPKPNTPPKIIMMECDDCGYQQEDMGSGVVCEDCGGHLHEIGE